MRINKLVRIPHNTLLDLVADYLENIPEHVPDDKFVFDIDFGLEVDEEGNIELDVTLDDLIPEVTEDDENIISFESVTRR